MERKITKAQVFSFLEYLREEEKSVATISKYKHDINEFIIFVQDSALDKKLTLAYKSFLEEKYTATSVISMLAAVNAIFKFLGWQDLCVKLLKVQRKAFLPEEKELTREEYYRLINCAEKRKNKRLSLIIQTLCSTGIRISELEFITVEAVRKGEAVVNCKGKTRNIFIVNALKQKLLSYIKSENIIQGPIFLTRSGKIMNRSNVWREMKSLCEEAEVSHKKVFPHNLRHLFARIFYSLEKDIAKLADILGHSNINTTRIYIMTTSKEHRRKMENMKLII